METGKEVVKISLNSIIPNRFQPRISFDEDALNELANSIKMYGILQPLILRPLGDKYEIIAGERRYKAATIAGLSEVPAILVNLDDKTSAELAIIENIQRKDLTAIEEAKSYSKLLDLGNYTQEQLAVKMGKKQSTIANKLRLLNLLPDTQDALMNGQISERHARSLLQLKDDPGKQREVLNKIISDRLTVKDTDELIKNMMGDNNVNDNIYNTLNYNNNTNEFNNFNSESNKSMDINTSSNNFDFYTPEADSFYLGTLSDPNLAVPTTPQPLSNNEMSTSFSTTMDIGSQLQPEQNSYPNFDSLLKKEEESKPVEEPVKPLVQIEQSPPANKYFPSLEDTPANMSFSQAYSTPEPLNTNNVNISMAINNTKDFIKNLESNGYKVETQEFDLPEEYEIIIKIKK